MLEVPTGADDDQVFRLDLDGLDDLVLRLDLNDLNDLDTLDDLVATPD